MVINTEVIYSGNSYSVILYLILTSLYRSTNGRRAPLMGALLAFIVYQV